MQNRLSPIALTLLLPVFAQAQVDRPKVVYGEDDRLEVHEASPARKTNTSAVAGMFFWPQLSVGPAETGLSYTLPQTSLSDGDGVCSEERFSSQPAAANCTGFLVGPDLLVTAGHCVTEDSDCTEAAWVFGYQVDPVTGAAGLAVPAGDVYRCKQVVDAKLDDDLDQDFALVQLDRPVRDRAPLAFRSSGRVADDADLVVLGHPSGLPLKIAGGAQVRDNSGRGSFVANLDTFHGNSGSPVLNQDTLEVEGILVRGEDDYVLDRERMCMVVNVCANDACSGESSSRITDIPELARGGEALAAAVSGDETALEDYLAAGLWADITNLRLETPLLLAVRAGQGGAVEQLLAAGASVSQVDIDGRGVLHFLAERENFGDGDEAVFLVLLGKGAEVGAVDRGGISPLQLALERGNLRLVELLLSAGAGNTPAGE